MKMRGREGGRKEKGEEGMGRKRKREKKDLRQRLPFGRFYQTLNKRGLKTDPRAESPKNPKVPDKLRFSMPQILTQFI